MIKLLAWIYALLLLMLIVYANGFPHSSVRKKESSPAISFLAQLRNNWKGIPDDARNRGQHRFVQEAYVNMAVMCSSQARQLANKDNNHINQYEDTYKEQLTEYGECLYHMAELLLEFPHVGTETPDIAFHQNNLIKKDITARFGRASLFMLMQRAAELGHAQAQHRLATAYATGVLHGGDGGLVPMDAGKALLLDYMATLGGSAEAHMAMGYRYSRGISVPESCERGLLHYEFAANVAVSSILKRGHPLQLEHKYLSEESKGPSRSKAEDDPEVIAYYTQLSAEGDLPASLNLAKMYYNGNRAIDQNLQQASIYFKRASELGSWASAGQLSYLLMQRLGGRLNDEYSDAEIFNMARKSADKGDANGVMAVGYAYLRGIGVPVNHTKAFELFMAAQGKHPDSSFHIGEMLVGRAGRSDSSNKGKYANVHSQSDSDITLHFLKQSGLRGENWVFEGFPTDLLSQPLRVTSTKELADRMNEFSEEEKNKLANVNLLVAEATKPHRAITAQTMQKVRQVQTAVAKLSSLWPASAHGRAAHQMSLQYKKSASPKKTLRKVTPEVEDEETTRSRATAIRESKEADYVAAVQQYSVAAQRGHILAMHRLAHMTKHGMGISASCISALNGFKAVAERGEWSRRLLLAYRAFDAGDRETALRLFSELAALGYEVAQFNAAYILSSQSQSVGAVAQVKHSVQKLWSTLTGSHGPPSVGPRWRYPADPLAAYYTQINSSSTTGEAEAETKPIQASSTQYSRHFMYSNSTARSLLALQPRQWGSSPHFVHANAKAAMSTSQLQEESTSDIFAFCGADSSIASRPLFNHSDISHAYDLNMHCDKDLGARALVLYALSAQSGNAEARMRVGDNFYYGLAGLLPDKKEAALRYQSAADHRNAHALFNLGLMYAVGDGVTRDYHLSKRYYDQAAEFDMEARMPRSIAVALLQGQQYLDSTEYGSRLVQLVVAAFWPDALPVARAAEGQAVEPWTVLGELCWSVLQTPFHAAAQASRSKTMTTWMYVPRASARLLLSAYIALNKAVFPTEVEEIVSLLVAPSAEKKNGSHSFFENWVRSVEQWLLGAPDVTIRPDATDCGAFLLVMFAWCWVWIVRRKYRLRLRRLN